MEDLKEKLRECEVCIIYKPLSDEIDPKSLFLNFPPVTYTTPQSHEVDPKDLISKIDIHQKGYVLVPGRKFDTFGGRIGRGKGWYDRFLAGLPSSWIRIGVCSPQSLSKEKLTLHSWDQKMNFVIAVSSHGKKVYTIKMQQ